MAYFTDKALISALPDSDEVPPEELAQLAEDANAVYGYVHHQPGAGEPQLRKWAEGRSMSPDRVTAALGLLRSMGRLFELSDEAAQVVVDGEPSTSQSRAKGKSRS